MIDLAKTTKPDSRFFAKNERSENTSQPCSNQYRTQRNDSNPSYSSFSCKRTFISSTSIPSCASSSSSDSSDSPSFLTRIVAETSSLVKSNSCLVKNRFRRFPANDAANGTPSSSSNR